MKKKRFKKIWVISLVLTAIFLGVVGSVAIYTSQVYQRAVVRNRYNDVIRFSSDKLYRVTDTSSPQKYYYPLGENQRTMTFTVCNYDQVKSTLYNENKIDYSISFYVSNGKDGFEYIVKKGNEEAGRISDGKTISIENNILQGSHRSVDTYSVTFDKDDYNKVEITVTVTPTDTTTTQNYKLNGTLIPIEYATTQGVRLEWSYPDSGRGTPEDFDAYNVLVSLAGGQGNVLVSWNYEDLEIDPFFADGKTVTSNEETKIKTIAVPMNSEDETGTYLITFYNHNNTRPLWTKWKKENESDTGYIPITVKLAE